MRKAYYVRLSQVKDEQAYSLLLNCRHCTHDQLCEYISENRVKSYMKAKLIEKISHVPGSAERKDYGKHERICKITSANQDHRSRRWLSLQKNLLWPIARAGFSASGSRLPEGRLVCNLFDQKNRAKIRILIPVGAFR